MPTQQKTLKKKREPVIPVPVIPIEDNTDYLKAKEYLLQGRNLFITGGAGTGKSYLLRKIKDELLPELHLTATTGIAAVNINGQTIHSWAGVGRLEKTIDDIVYSVTMNVPLLKQILSAKYLAVDEISMLSARGLDKINEVLKRVRQNRQPMGGIQIILIGDFFQLPPVVKGRQLIKSDFCFSSSTWKELQLQTILLKDVKRQTDFDFIQLLNDIRDGQAKNHKDKGMLGRREAEVKEFLNSPESKDILTLFATNREADNHNKKCLDTLKTKECLFMAKDMKEFEYEREGKIKTKREALSEDDIKWLKNKEKKDIRIPKELKLKVGCRVMLLKNLNVYDGLVNGSCGTVKSIHEGYINVKFDDGRNVPIEREESTISVSKFKQTIKIKNKEKTISVVSEKQSLIRLQFPLALAYGISIHKSQGMTVDKLVVNCARIFAEGQAYVALSRVRSLQGLYLQNYDPQKIYVNENVLAFYNHLLNNEPENTDPMEQITLLIQQAIEKKAKLQIKYQKNEFNSSAITERIVIPQQLGYGEELNWKVYPLKMDELYLVAFCTLRQEQRTFKLDRILDAILCEE